MYLMAMYLLSLTDNDVSQASLTDIDMRNHT